MLAVQNLSVRIQGRTIVDRVSLLVGPGEVVGLLGPNGAGKTTCFRSILGQVRAASGSVKLDDRDISHLPMHRRARLGIGYLPQDASVFRGLTVAENIRAALQLRPDLNRRTRGEELERLLSELQVGRIRGSLGAGLSGGERRRVELARALAARPHYLLLDEPFAGVDPVSIDEIRRLVTEVVQRGIGVLITDHNVRETLKLCDRGCILAEGRVMAQGSPAEVVTDPRVRKAYLGADFQL